MGMDRYTYLGPYAIADGGITSCKKIKNGRECSKCKRVSVSATEAYCPVHGDTLQDRFETVKYTEPYEGNSGDDYEDLIDISCFAGWKECVYIVNKRYPKFREIPVIDGIGASRLDLSHFTSEFISEQITAFECENEDFLRYLRRVYTKVKIEFGIVTYWA
jgi:hypothetical protein